MKAFAIMTAITVVVATMTGCAPLQQGSAQTGSISFPSSVAAPSVGTAAGQFPAVGTAAGVSGTVVGTAPAAVQTPGLVDILVQQLGITPEQAAGGAGSIFSTAKQSMSPADFAQLIKAVPGMNRYLSSAPSQVAPISGTTDLMGMASSALGGSTNALSNMALMAGSFQSLGLNPSMVSQFIPVILQYVQTQGGSGTMGLLQSALFGAVTE